jgi:hypothetical protein
MPITHITSCCSGGERSYTMVALLLAIGRWNETPFRCMDEYDVSALGNHELSSFVRASLGLFVAPSSPAFRCMDKYDVSGVVPGPHGGLVYWISALNHLECPALHGGF